MASSVPAPTLPPVPPPPPPQYKTMAQYKALLEEVYPGLSTGGNQWKFGHAETHTSVAGPSVQGAPRPTYNMSQVHAVTSYEPEMQALRWLSSMARQWLIAEKKQKVEEVQALFDSETGQVWITANKAAHTDLLKTGEWLTWVETAQPAFGDAFGKRYNRHRGKVQKDLARAKAIAESLRDQPGLDGVQPCRASIVGGSQVAPDALPPVPPLDGVEQPRFDRRMQILKPAAFVYPELSDRHEMHAESKILKVWTETRGRARDRTQPNTKLVVAGVMRPCLCCYVRLRRHARDVGALGADLAYKHERPGPFWPSASALYGMTDEDHRAIETHVRAHRPHFVSRFRKYQHDSDSEDDDAPLAVKPKRPRKRKDADEASASPSSSTKAKKGRKPSPRPAKRARQAPTDEEDDESSSNGDDEMDISDDPEDEPKQPAKRSRKKK